MERHQAGQEEALVEVKLEMDSLEALHGPRGSPVDRCGCFKCAGGLAAVMGLVTVALVAGFFLHFFMFMPSCNQDTPPSNDTAKINTTFKLKMSGDIFTVNKTATYLIFGWVRFSDDTSKEVTLMQTLKGNNRTIEKKTIEEEFCFIGQKVILLNSSSLSIYSKSHYTDSLFHVYEL
ncbi:uncharacterized protein LOC144463733 [Epinephelus lanceolatus]